MYSVWNRRHDPTCCTASQDMTIWRGHQLNRPNSRYDAFSCQVSPTLLLLTFFSGARDQAEVHLPCTKVDAIADGGTRAETSFVPCMLVMLSRLHDWIESTGNH